MKIGDRITFKAVCRWSGKTVTRTILGFNMVGNPLVRYGGYDDFTVRLHEINKINGKEVKR